MGQVVQQYNTRGAAFSIVGFIVELMQIITKSGKAKILDKLTVAELRVELDRRGLSSKGAKSALSKRLAKASSAGGASAAAPSAHTIDNPVRAADCNAFGMRARC